MAIEQRRGCGYRKVGGLYLVGEGLSIGCGRLPFNLDVCPTCSAGIKFCMGFTWVDGTKLLAPKCEAKHECHAVGCAVCDPETLGRCGLMWVGSRFYTPDAFTEEAMKMGVSKRIASVPRGFVVGKTWILLAHRQAGYREVETKENLMGKKLIKDLPAIFYAFMPKRIEKILTASEATQEELDKLVKQGITPVIVPDNDKDHQGTVYDKEEKHGNEKREKREPSPRRKRGKRGGD